MPQPMCVIKSVMCRRDRAGRARSAIDLGSALASIPSARGTSTVHAVRLRRPTLDRSLETRRASLPAASRHLRMFTARATTITARLRLIADCTSMSIFAHRLSGSASVGLNADEFVNDTNR
jgi:hypothetical protein